MNGAAGWLFFIVGAITSVVGMIPIEQQTAQSQARSYWTSQAGPTVSAPAPYGLALSLLGGTIAITGLVMAYNAKPESEKEPAQPTQRPQLAPAQPQVYAPQPVQYFRPQPIQQQIAPPVQDLPIEIEEEESDEVEPEYRWIYERFLPYPCKLIFGEQGGGKTSKAGFLAAESLKRGDRVSVANPIPKAGEWDGLEIFGGGDEPYRDIEAGLMKFVSCAKSRLAKRSTEKGYDPLKDEQHWLLVCDEMTDWADSIESAIMKAFVSCCTQFLRQANMSVVFVAHGDTNACIGGDAVVGKKDVIQRQFVRLQTIAKPDPSVPGGLRCAGQAILSIPHREPERVAVPTWMQPPSGYDFTALIPQKKKTAEPSKEAVYADELRRRAAEFNLNDPWSD